MKIFLFAAVFIFSSLILLSCKKDNPVKPKEQPQAIINLSVEDVSCTEAWIKLSTSNISLPADVQIIKDSNLTRTISLTGADTILYIDSLSPKQTYSFHTILQPYNHTGEITSNSVSVTTMDTTSHKFTWQTYTCGGQAGSCVLNDIAIIDKNNIWAVGEIYLNDSLGNTISYNAVHWDGTNWEVKRILYLNGFAPMTAIWAFNENDIWFGIGYLIHWDGTSYTEMSIPDWHIRTNKIWGISSNEIYVVGNNGNIAHYQNGNWSRIESGTDLNINDIYGAYNDNTNQWKILAPAANVLQSLDRDLLSINDNYVDHLDTSPITGTLRTIWFIPNRTYLLGGGGIYRKSYLTDSLWEKKDNGITDYSTNRIRGIAINDIVLTGGYGELLHYNGYSFKSYLNQTQINGNYYSVDIKNNIIVAVGNDSPAAVIIIGNRTN